MDGKNEWLHGYLEAILDVKAGSSSSNNIRKRLEELKEDNNQQQQLLFSPTKYFVEEIVNTFEETDIHRTWIKFTSRRDIQQRNNRLENMCWRIWHIARRKKRIAWDATRNLERRRYEREKGKRDAAEDLSELSEGEKESNTPASAAGFSRVNSDTQIWSEDKPRSLYLVLISVHGLIRGDNMELGRDPDTGGQVKYVVELARSLGNMAAVYRVDLITRQISSPEVNSVYGEPVEMLSSPSDEVISGGVYIIRIPCGPSNRYIPKESLWPYIGEFVDGALGHIVHVGKSIGEEINNGKPVKPYVIHGHYADAGEAASLLCGVLNVPMVLTGHSLGRNKLQQLLRQGTLTREDIDSTYKITRRIEAEERALDAAAMVVTSTRQEVDDQWGLYDGFDVHLERKLRIRRRRGVGNFGRYMPRMVVIPPGIEFMTEKGASDSDTDLKSLIDRRKSSIPLIWSEIMRFFKNPHKPMILALSRPDPKKNVVTLLKAFGESRILQELANMTLILGNRDNIEEMPESSSILLTTILKLIDKYNLYGRVAYPKHHKQNDVPEIYRLAAKTKGVFINPALVEPFGLTLIEAAAYGLPIVATKNGGPVDILKAMNNGLLVDPHDHQSITDALLKLLTDKSLWHECRKNGLKNIHNFSWTEHCKTYLSHIEHCRNYHPTTTTHNQLPIPTCPEEPLSESLRGVEEDIELKFSTDIDVTGELDAFTRQQKVIEILSQKSAFTGEKSKVGSSFYSPGRRKWLYVIAVDSYETLPLIIKKIKQAATGGSNSTRIGFVLMTGLSLQETKDMLSDSQLKVEDFDALVCCSGSEIHYPWRDIEMDEDYESNIQFRWPGENVKSIITRLAEIELSHCRPRCYSYRITSEIKAQMVEDLRLKLRMGGIRCNLVCSNAGTRLNVIPVLASRSQALRYLSVRWGIELTKSALFLGERGDTDHKDLIIGLHRTVIIKKVSETMAVNGNEACKEDDAVAKSSSRVSFVEGVEFQELFKILGCSE